MISSLALARLCGVSQGTVDRALHGRPGVSAATRDRILEAARKQGYLPNPAARELMGLAASPVIGVVLPEGGIHEPFFMDLVSAIGVKLRDQDLRLSLWPCRAEEFAAVATDIAARRLRALIMALAPEDMRLPSSVTRAIPVMALLLPNRSPGVISLIPDEEEIGRIATQHLIDLGHRRIVHLDFPAQHSVVKARAAGYRAAMRGAGLHPQVITEPDSGRLLARLRELGATAVFCHNDSQALALVRHLNQAGLSVPGDISVVGVDRSPTAAALDPTLTSVAYPYAGIATQVAAVLKKAVPAPLPTPRLERGLSSGPPRDRMTRSAK
jgi:LacI family transcriptional regulator